MEVKQTYSIQCNCSVEYIFHQARIARPDFPVAGRRTKQFLLTAVILLEDVKACEHAAAFHVRIICLIM